MLTVVSYLRPRGFDFASLPGLIVELDPARETAYANNDPVGLATNFAAAPDFTAAGAARPTYLSAGWPGGAPAFSYAGAQALVSSSTISISTFTILIACKLTGAAGYLYEHGANSFASTGSYCYGSIGASINVFRGVGPSAKDRANNWAVDNAAKVVCQEYPDGLNANHKMYIDAQTASVMTPVASNDGNTAAVIRSLNLGRDGSASLGSTGLFRLFLVYSPALSAADRQTLIAQAGAYTGVAIGP